RHFHVTGVQTCPLPISAGFVTQGYDEQINPITNKCKSYNFFDEIIKENRNIYAYYYQCHRSKERCHLCVHDHLKPPPYVFCKLRSEERRVGIAADEARR